MESAVDGGIVRRLTGERPRLAVAVAYALLVCLAYAPVVFQGRGLHPIFFDPFLDPSDQTPSRQPFNNFEVELATGVYYEYPQNRLVGHLYRRILQTGQVWDHLPLWNPYQGVGYPLAAQYSTSAFFPYQVLEDVAPAVWTDFFLLGRAWLAGLGTFLFLSGLPGISRGAAFLGGILYMFSGAFGWFLFLEQMSNVALTIPFLMWAIDRMTTRGGGRAIAAAGFAAAMTLLAGQPEVALVAFAMAAAYGLLRGRMAGASWTAAGLRGLAALWIGLGLAAPLWIPFLELVAHAHTLHPPGGDMGTRSVDAIFAILMFFPSFFGDATYYRLFPRNGAWDHLGGYCGLVTPLLCLGGLRGVLFRSTAPSTTQARFFVFFFLNALFWIFKNFGFPPFVLIGRLPLFDQVWTPRWSGPIWTFSLAAAAAVAWDILKNARTTPRTGETQAATESRVRRRWILALATAGATAHLCQYLTSVMFTDAESGHSTIGQSAVHALYLKIVRLVADGPSGDFATTYSFNLIAFALTMIAFLALLGRITAVQTSALALLAFGELALHIPFGYAPAWNAWRLVSFLCVLGAAWTLRFPRLRVAPAALLVAACAAFVAIDRASPRGLPLRADPLDRQPWVDALRARDGVPFYRAIGYDRFLFPNAASGAPPLRSAHLVTAVCPALYFDYYMNHLLCRPLDVGHALWFTGITDFPIFPEIEPRAVNYDIAYRLPFYSAIGARYVLTPPDVDLNRLPPSTVRAPREPRTRENLLSQAFWQQTPPAAGAKGPPVDKFAVADISRTPALTLAFRVRPDKDQKNDRTILFDFGYTERENFIIEGRRRGEEGWAWYLLGGNVGVSFLLPEGRWTHVAAAIDTAAGEFRVYLDGVLAAAQRMVMPPRLTAKYFRFGSAVSGDAPFSGGLTDITLWNRTLTDTEAALLAGVPSVSQRIPRFILLQETDSFRLFENPTALPRVYLARRLDHASSPQEAQALVARLENARAPVAVVEEEISLPPVDDTTDPPWNATLSVDAPNRVAIDVETAAPGILVLADLHFPGWEASIDGELCAIHRVNGLVRGVRVPAGRHTVTFVYRPWSFIAGLGLAAAAIACCGILSRLDRRRV